jgi:hypothetical protein
MLQYQILDETFEKLWEKYEKILKNRECEELGRRLMYRRDPDQNDSLIEEEIRKRIPNEIEKIQDPSRLCIILMMDGLEKVVYLRALEILKAHLSIGCSGTNIANLQQLQSISLKLSQNSHMSEKAQNGMYQLVLLFDRRIREVKEHRTIQY